MCLLAAKIILLMCHLKILIVEYKQYQPAQLAGCSHLMCFFRSFKNVHRRFCTQTRLKFPQIKIYTPDNMLRLIACTHIQYCAPIFEDFIRFAFVKPGYINRASEDRFTSPLQYLFHENVKRNVCSAKGCVEMATIQCAWCKGMLCMIHLAFCRQIHFCKIAEQSMLKR